MSFSKNTYEFWRKSTEACLFKKWIGINQHKKWIVDYLTLSRSKAAVASLLNRCDKFFKKTKYSNGALVKFRQRSDIQK